MTDAKTEVQEMDYGFFDSVKGGYNDIIAPDSTGDSSEEYFPMSYANTPGTYKFRIYPENYNGRPRFYREVWHHKLPQKDGEKIKNIKAISPLNDNRISDIIVWAEKEGLKSKKNGAWKYKSSKYGVLMVHMYEAPENKYIKKGSTGLVLNYKQIDEFKNFLQSIETSGSDLLSFLDPRNSNPGLVMNISADRKTTFGVTGGPMKAINFELPPMELPVGHKFEGLDKVYVNSDQFVTDEMVAKFREFIEEEVEKYQEYVEARGLTNNPEDGEQGYQIPTSNTKYEKVFEEMEAENVK